VSGFGRNDDSLIWVERERAKATTTANANAKANTGFFAPLRMTSEEDSGKLRAGALLSVLSKS
jgi:hypothetical protein